MFMNMMTIYLQFMVHTRENDKIEHHHHHHHHEMMKIKWPGLKPNEIVFFFTLWSKCKRFLSTNFWGRFHLFFFCCSDIYYVDFIHFDFFLLCITSFFINCFTWFLLEWTLYHHQCVCKCEKNWVLKKRLWTYRNETKLWVTIVEYQYLGKKNSVSGRWIIIIITSSIDICWLILIDLTKWNKKNQWSTMTTTKNYVIV